jgi:hypothetical protein
MDNEENFKQEILAQEAIEIVVGASKFVESLGVNSQNFFRVSDTSIEHVPLNGRPTQEYDPNDNHFWIFSAGQRSLDLDESNVSYFSERYSYGFDSPYLAAMEQLNHLNSEQDHFVRSASGASGGKNIVNDQILVDGLTYAIMVATHEPFHRHLDIIYNINLHSDLNEACTTHFGIETMELYKKTLSIKPNIQPAIDDYLERHEIKTRFFDIAICKLENLYGRDIGSSRRDSVENELLSIIENVHSHMNGGIPVVVNNAMLVGKKRYTGYLIVQDFFQLKKINFTNFLQMPFSDQSLFFQELEGYYNDSLKNRYIDIDSRFEEILNQVYKKDWV